MHGGGSITLKSLSVAGTVVRYDFLCEGEVSEVFNGRQGFEVDFFEDVSSVPESMLAIPFVVNVLPIAWIYDALVEVEEVDKNFFDNIHEIKKGYINMHPRVEFKGGIEAHSVVKNSLDTDKVSTGLLFSGGVDATSSLISMIKSGQKPRLITIWGADVDLDDYEGWEEKSGHTNYIADVFKLDTGFVKSTFRQFLNEELLNRKIRKLSDDNWWHGFQHGIGIIGHSAPFAYKYNLRDMYIAASFVRGDNVTCASDPTIDENLHMGGTSVIHEGYDLTRQQKVANIHQFISSNADINSLPIKVCWKSQGAKNCGKCEKCMRTACEIIAEGGDVGSYSLDKFSPEYMRKHLIKDNFFFHTRHWKGIQDRLRKGDVSNSSVDAISWLIDVDFDSVDSSIGKRAKLVLKNIKRAIRGAMPRGLISVIRRARGRW